MTCPKCNTPLREREQSGVVIDFCPTCRGIWLDSGELEKLIQSEQRYYDNDDGGDDDDGDDDDGGAVGGRGGRGRRGGFLENLMDVFGN